MPLDAPTLARTLEHFLNGSRNAVVLEDGQVVFDLLSARYSVSGEHGKALLHIWSEERNAVRRVVDCESRNGTLKLMVRRFGQAKPTKLEICLGRDYRSPSARRAARAAYETLLRRVLEREYAGSTVEPLRSTADLERSFSPVYARGVIRSGRSAFAVLGVNSQEPQAAIDGALTFAILWLDHCRQRLAERAYVEGLKLFVPAGTSAIVRERMAHLNHTAAKFELYEFHERERGLQRLDCADRGNIATRLVHCPNETAAKERFRNSIGQVLTAAGKQAESIDTVVLSPAEISFRIRGLEFARARVSHDPRSLQSAEELLFGLGAAEHVVNEENESQLRELIERIAGVRHSQGDHADPLWRMHPERWLESLVIGNVSALDSRLLLTQPAPVYSQVPAFSASDRAMIDVLTATRDGQLAVIELKADEDLHLPLQGIDYWARVNWHHSRGEFRRFGYFPSTELAPDPPLLMLVAPALRVHPATDTLLRYIAPEIDWSLIGIDENWREGVRVLFRKRRTSAAAV